MEDIQSYATYHLGHNIHRRMTSNKDGHGEVYDVTGMANEIIYVDIQNQFEFVKE